MQSEVFGGAHHDHIYVTGGDGLKVKGDGVGVPHGADIIIVNDVKSQNITKKIKKG